MFEVLLFFFSFFVLLFFLNIFVGVFSTVRALNTRFFLFLGEAD